METREFKFFIASLLVHGAVFSSMIFDWGWAKKETYMDSDILLMGENTGTKINPPKPKADKVVQPKVMENDPNAVKTNEKQAQESTQEQSEGTFGQGGTKPLEYFTELSAWIKVNQKYPKMARRLGQEGEVKVGFNVNPDGRLTDIQVLEKSQYEALNEAAAELIAASSPFKPFPDNFPKKPIWKEQPVSYKLIE